MWQRPTSFRDHREKMNRKERRKSRGSYKDAQNSLHNFVRLHKLFFPHLQCLCKVWIQSTCLSIQPSSSPWLSPNQTLYSRHHLSHQVYKETNKHLEQQVSNIVGFGTMVRCSICEQENLEESPLKHLPETLEGKICTMTGKYYILMLLHKKEYKKGLTFLWTCEDCIPTCYRGMLMVQVWYQIQQLHSSVIKSHTSRKKPSRV